MSKDRQRTGTPSLLVSWDEWERPSCARSRACKAASPFRNQSCEGRAWKQDPAQPSLSRSSGPDLHAYVRRRAGQVTALRFFSGARRRNFLEARAVRTNHERQQWTAGRAPLAIPQVVGGKGVDL